MVIETNVCTWGPELMEGRAGPDPGLFKSQGSPLTTPKVLVLNIQSSSMHIAIYISEALNARFALASLYPVYSYEPTEQLVFISYKWLQRAILFVLVNKRGV